MARTKRRCIRVSCERFALDLSNYCEVHSPVADRGKRKTAARTKKAYPKKKTTATSKKTVNSNKAAAKTPTKVDFDGVTKTTKARRKIAKKKTI